MKKKRLMALSRMGDEEIQAYDHFDDSATFEYKYSLIPRRCYDTNKLIWGLAIRGRRYYRVGEVSGMHEDRWYHRHGAIIKMLKG